MQDEEYTKHRRAESTKTTAPAALRMRQRTAKQQLAEAIRLSRGPEDIPLPDADDSSLRGVMR
jgi:hypothetical protein